MTKVTKKGRGRQFVVEQGRRRPVLCEVDVVVAGAGLCGTFAAIAAGRCGARTLVVERMPSLGGNIGPGMVLGGSIEGEGEVTLPTGLTGIAREFVDRLNALCAPVEVRRGLATDKGEPFRTGMNHRNPEEASAASYLARGMMREAGVRVLLSSYAADPIVRGKTVKGLFVEARGGRYAVPATVTIDDTGIADIARRAGAPMKDYLRIASGEGVDERYVTEQSPDGMIRKGYMRKEYPTYYNDTLILCLVGNVNLARYERFLRRRMRLSTADRKLVDEHFHHLPRSYWPALVKAWRQGTLPLWKDVTPQIRVSSGLMHLWDYGRGVAGFRISAHGAIDAGDPLLVSKVEDHLRTLAFESVAFLREHIDGFEQAYLLTTQPFFGFRGGPHIQGDHTLTVEEMFAETRFDDVLYRNIHEVNHGGPPSGFDVPYRAALPRGLDGLLVCGRGAAYERRGHDPSGMRARPSMMVFGQTVGTAAGIAARDNVTPRKVDVRKVQRRLVRDGIVLGESARLQELGIA